MSSHSFVICIVVFIVGLESSRLTDAITVRSAVPTVPTKLTSTKSPIIAIGASKVSESYGTDSREAEDDYSREPDVEGAPPDYIVPYSEHENPEEPSTRSKYTNGNGDTVKPRVELDFVPTKLYAQVRKTHTVKRLPREDALKSATNEEEVLAAPRLREVVTKSKTNTVYTEEGYEDAAYDHAGHVRDADFQEDYAKKIGDPEEIVELNDDEKESEIHEGVKVDTIKNPTELDRLWRDPSINPKQVTENEIAKLGQDLENEYKESEKNAETEVPENLKKPYESDEEESTTERRDGEEVTEKDDDSDEFSNDASAESAKNEILENYVSKPQINENASGSINPSVDYGKVFWDYFKSVGNDDGTDKFGEAKNIEKTPKSFDATSPKVSTTVPTLSGVHTAPTDLNSDFHFSPGTELNGFISNRMDYSPSAGSLYESWKRRDFPEDSKESIERESSESYVEKSEEEIQEADDFERNASALNLQSVQGSTTLIGPKKLSYTVIIRPSEKPRTETCPCDREAHGRPGERTPIVKSLLREPEVVAPDGMNDFSNANDFTAIEAPLSAVPLRQVTYSDFLPHSYASVAHPSAKPEIGTNPRQIHDGERDRYELVKNSYVNHPQNSHPRYNRFRGHPKSPRQFYPITKLVPPSSINRSKYSDFQNVQSVARPLKKLDTISNFHPWPEIVRFYRSIERRIFPRHKRSLVDENNNFSSSSHAYKIRDGIFNVSSVKQLRLKRNLFGESNRLVGADNDAASEKSIGLGRRLRRASEKKLLHEAPRIVDEVIDGEIESRFKDDDDTEEDNDEKPENIEIDVPDFNFSDVIENNESEKIIEKPVVRKVPLDIRKYPFYENSNIPRASALKYITNPRTVPRKTLGGTEFYDSRDKYRECEEVKPDLDSALLPEKTEEEEDEDESEEQQRENRPRLHGLGDRLDCFRAKYFDDDPLDNPLFFEKDVGQPRLPEELDLTKLDIRISDMSNVQEHEVGRRVSNKPRESNRMRSRNSLSTRNRNQMNREKEANAHESRINEIKKLARGSKIRKQRLRTTTKAPKILTTPYQHEVYEDVMGTIKNLAGLYETFGEPPVSASSILPEASRALVTPRGRKVDFESIHITERPRGFMVQRLLPPEFTEPTPFQRYRIVPYRTNKASYRTRLRTSNAPGGEGTKLGYFRTVTVHKRSVKSEGIPLDSNRPKSRSVSNHSKSRSDEIDEQPAASERIVYTIKDRIRHSKPRGNSARQKHNSGNLEASASEAVRSQESRNHRIARKKVIPRESRYTGTARRKGPKNDPEELVTAAASSESPATSNRHDYLEEPDEMYKIQYSTTRGKQVEPNNLQRRNVKVYDDEENVDGDVAKKQDPESKEASTEEAEFYQLRKYLESDPPGYSEAFGDKSRDSETENPATSYKSAESRKEAASDVTGEEDEEKEDEEEGQIEKPSGSLVNEESSSASGESNDPPEQLKSDEKPESKEEGEFKESEVVEADEEDEDSPRVEDETASDAEDSEKEFERFASRPYSPFESYEDSKYMEIGPRLSKPYFYHPSFSTLNSGRKKYSKDRSNEERSESDEKNSKYAFPWDASKSEEEDVEKSSEESLKVERYEYPWERRERLARERRRKEKERKEHERLYGFPDDGDEQDDEPEDASGTRFRSKRVYPWEHYKVPSKSSARKKSARRRIIDNEEMSSEHRPRFSSRYKTANYSSYNDSDPVAASIEPRATKNGPAQLTDVRNTARANKLAGTTVTSTQEPPAFTVPSKKATRRRMQTQTIATTQSATSSSETKRKKRIWPAATTTTRKPIVRKRQQSVRVAEESLGSGSQKDVIVIEPSGGNIRRRRPPMSRSTSSNSSATSKKFRPRYQKTTLSPQQVNAQPEESTMKNIVMKNTTPRKKTTEHRSRFSKEEIITKTSYPRLNENNEQDVIGSEENGDSSRNGSLNETVRKVSIMTKETPEHIYRTEEIDKNGVKGKFVSITLNNGTNSSLDMGRTPGQHGLIDHEETKEMLKGFTDSEENNDEQDSVISSLETNVSFLPRQSGIFQFSAQGSTKMMSSLAWISENYDN